MENINEVCLSSFFEESTCNEIELNNELVEMCKKLETQYVFEDSDDEELVDVCCRVENLRAISVEIPRVHRSVKQFPTGSQYEGTWDMLGMSGYGVYTFSNGVIYEGEFDDGVFHGNGELRYPSGAILRGTWKRGQIVQKTLIFADGLQYKETDWEYCRMPDRRFTIEYATGLQPAGRSYLTAEQPTRPVPPGYYDTGDGFYDPKTRVVYKANDLTAIIRSPSIREQKWIIENCRTSPDNPLGPRKDLYEEWSVPQPEPKPTPSTSNFTMMQSLSHDSLEDEECTQSTTRWNHQPLLHYRDFF